VTAPIAIGLNMIVVEWRILTPNRITILSFLCAVLASIFILKGTSQYFVGAVLLLHLNHILDCMDGQMAKYRGISTPFGSFFDKVTDQFKVFLFLGSTAYTTFRLTGNETAILLGFIGVAFYFIRVYVKYLTIFIEIENDPNYLKRSSEIVLGQVKSKLAGPRASISTNLIWFLKEQRKFFLFNETVFIFLISFGLLFNRTMEILWLVAISQVYYACLRSYQRGRQIYLSHHAELLKPLEK